jgi:hypothetical protein
MDKDAQLRRRLGHATSKVGIRIIDSSVMNYTVSDTDVCNKESANGAPIAGLLGKTTKNVFMSAGCVIASRVTQV